MLFRSVDIGTRNTIYQIIRKIAEKGIGVVVVSSDFEEVLGLSDRVVVLSDGVSVAQARSELLDAEILAMYAAPRSSAQGLHDVLADLSARYSATAYWLQIERGRVFCFDLVANSEADTGIDANQFPLIEETLIPLALAYARGSTVIEDGSLRSVMFKLTNQSGHSFGYLGLSVKPSESAPQPLSNPEAIRATILNCMTGHDVGQLLIAAQTEENEA